MGVNRRQVLSLGVVGLVSGCLGLFDEDARRAGASDRDEHDPYEDDDEYDDPYEPEPDADLEFEGFTHFPFDFEHAFSDPESFWDDGYVPWPIEPYFTPWDKVFHSAKWYLNNPHDPLYWDVETNIYYAEWESYLLADAILTADDIRVVYDLEGNPVWDDYFEFDGELAQYEIDGDPAYGNIDVDFRFGDGISARYEKFRVRKAVLDAVEAGRGVARFDAGTHVGYGLGAIMVYDDTADPYPFDFTLPNPFDYFTEEKQQELLDLYQPMYDLLQDEGVHPFTDLTKSDIYWDEPGTINGTWLNNNLPCYEIMDEVQYWGALSLIGTEHINHETYWRVLDHPWNRANNFIGLFADATIREHEWPDRYLYELGDLDEPLGWSRYYLLDGDLSAGIALIIVEDHEWGWNAMEPDGPENHPSMGERRYLRFEVEQAADMWDETLTIQGFTTEEGARTGFTGAALEYRRSVEDC